MIDKKELDRLQRRTDEARKILEIAQEHVARARMEYRKHLSNEIEALRAIAREVVK